MIYSHGLKFINLIFEVKMSLTACFSKLLKNGLMKNSNSPLFRNSAVRYSKLWEPDYLILGETKTPEYDLINIQIKGYDFVILEKYQKIINGLARKLKINVEDGWASPAQDFKVQKFKPNSSDIENEYKLNLYERNVQIVDAKSHQMALFIEALVTSCPPGVTLNLHEHTKEIEENRYVPSYEIKELNEALHEIGKKPD